ncbi:MAG TPA: hypothetical protein VGE04_20570 [Chloroflexia bacterium]
MTLGELGGWPLAVLAVIALAAATVGFALLIGRWIDAQSNSVLDPPRKGRKRDSDRE